MTAQPSRSSSSGRDELAPMLLGIDCATPFLALALLDRSGAQVAEVSLEVGRDHAGRLLPELKLLLARAGASGREVAAIGVGVGPGSYTGVRVAIATARGLARAWNVPVAGAPSLLTLLPSDLAPGERGVALLDARRDNVYAVLAEQRGSPEPRFTVLDGPLKLPRQELETRFPGVARFEDLAPNAAVLALAALDGGASDALYL